MYVVCVMDAWPNERLDNLRVLAVFEEGCGERVAQAVEGEALIPEPGVFEQRLELSVVDVVVVRGPANPVGEHEVVVVPLGDG